MHGDQLCSIGKGAFHLNFRQHFRYAGHDVFPGQEGGSIAHQVRDGAAIANAFQYGGGNVCHCLGVV